MFRPLSMAAKSDRGLKDLQQEITCPLCLDTFEDPRVLPCQHAYCKSCLDHLATRGALSCPECRKVPLLAGGVVGLPVAFQINRLKEVVARMTLEGEGEKATGTVESDGPTADVPERQGSVSSCSHHPSQSLDLYCRQCEELVCRDCILFGKKHVGHPYNKVEVVTKNCRRKVRRELASLLQKQPAITRAVADVRTARQVVQESRGVISSKISESYDRVISIVEEKKEKELRQFQSEADAKLQEMETHEATLTSLMSEVNAVQSLVERGVEGLGDVEFMAREKGMVLKIKQMLQRISHLSSSQPSARMHTQAIGSESAEAVYLHPYRVVDLSRCTATVARGNEYVQVGVAIASVLLVDSEGHPCPLQQCVTMELCSPRFGNRVIPEVVCQSPSRYEAHYTPTLGTRGHCQLIIKVNGHMIGSGPIKVFIACPFQQLGEPVHIINGIQGPCCLKIFNEQMFCINPSKGLNIIDLNNTSAPPTPSGMFPKFGKLQRWRPVEMTIDKELSIIYVSDILNDMVHMFKMNGQYLKSTGRKGSALGKFNDPNGLCISRDGVLYVCDTCNYRIQVFDRDLKFLGYFGSPGTGPGQFNGPDNIDFDASGRLYVTDVRNHHVQCLTADGDPIRCIGREGSGPGEFSQPNILKVFDGHVFVTDDTGVSVFTTGGQFVSRFAAMCCAAGECLNGLDVDEDGFVYVSDSSRNRIVVF